MSNDHSSRAHALLSASGAERWMACTPSARLEEKYTDSTSPFAEEGTKAHELSDNKLRLWAGEISKRQYASRLKKIKESEFYGDEMETETDKYVDYVQEIFAGCGDQPLIIIEQRVDFSDYVEKGFGTGDVLIASDDTLHVIDLKYGKGVEVSAVNNPQLMLYALGAYKEVAHIYEFSKVVTHIVQPRLNNYSSYLIDVPDLIEWGEKKVRPLATQAYEGEGELNPGPHCRWCKAKVKCPALAAEVLKTAKQEFRDDELSDEELLEIYDMIPIIQAWIKAAESHILQTALEGKTWEGLKVVEGTSRRKVKDEEAVQEVLIGKGYKLEEFTTTKLNGITALEKLIGKKDFTTVLGAYIEKPEGKPTLAPIDDRRPEFKKAQILKDFS